MHTNQLVASQSYVTTALSSYALSSSLGSFVPTSRTITINGTALDLSADRSWTITSMIYPAAGIALSTGTAWGTSITNNSANWNTAYGWGNHATAGYAASSHTHSIANITGLQTALDGKQASLGFTPYNSTNPSGYITSSGSITGSAGSVAWTGVTGRPTALSSFSNDSGYLTSVSISNITDAHRFWNNMGNNHGTHTDFNSVSNFGIRYLQGSTNGPGTGASQFYGMTLGLGNEYSYGTYAMQMAIPRTAGDNYITYRTQEGGSWGGWRRISAGYADSAGSVSNGMYLSGSQVITGEKQFQTNNGGSAVNNSNSASLQAFSTGNNTAFMSFHRGGYWATNFGLDNDNWIRIGGWSAAANRFQFNAVSGDFVCNGDVTAFSDARVKENIITVDNALAKVLALRGVYYNRIDSEDKSRKIGVIAQETLTVLPEVVNTDAFGTYNVSYGNIGGLFIEAFKEQDSIIKGHSDVIKDLQEEIDELKSIIYGLTR
jgi:hypothetical protein